MKNKVAYIAGPITKLPFDEVKERFENYQRHLEAKGYDVINPVELIELINKDRLSVNLKPITEYRQIMAACLNELCRCADEIHLLKGWRKSKGAKIEAFVAMCLDIDMVFVNK